ncbi:MAG: hypothetical protein K2Q01_08935 [Rickettsiales bacterium]|nr:hypothetical protein [Rickettsiales bacterium]
MADKEPKSPVSLETGLDVANRNAIGMYNRLAGVLGLRRFNTVDDAVPGADSALQEGFDRLRGALSVPTTKDVEFDQKGEEMLRATKRSAEEIQDLPVIGTVKKILVDQMVKRVAPKTAEAIESGVTDVATTFIGIPLQRFYDAMPKGAQERVDGGVSFVGLNYSAAKGEVQEKYDQAKGAVKEVDRRAREIGNKALDGATGLAERAADAAGGLLDDVMGTAPAGGGMLVKGAMESPEMKRLIEQQRRQQEAMLKAEKARRKAEEDAQTRKDAVKEYDAYATTNADKRGSMTPEEKQLAGLLDMVRKQELDSLPPGMEGREKIADERTRDVYVRARLADRQPEGMPDYYDTPRAERVREIISAEPRVAEMLADRQREVLAAQRNERLEKDAAALVRESKELRLLLGNDPTTLTAELGVAMDAKLTTQELKQVEAMRAALAESGLAGAELERALVANVKEALSIREQTKRFDSERGELVNIALSEALDIRMGEMQANMPVRLPMLMDAPTAERETAPVERFRPSRLDDLRTIVQEPEGMFRGTADRNDLAIFRGGMDGNDLGIFRGAPDMNDLGIFRGGVGAPPMLSRIAETAPPAMPETIPPVAPVGPSVLERASMPESISALKDALGDDFSKFTASVNKAVKVMRDTDVALSDSNSPLAGGKGPDKPRSL